MQAIIRWFHWFIETHIVADDPWDLADWLDRSDRITSGI